MSEAWDGAAVRAWLASRVAAARADQVVAERRGRDGQDDCDAAAAEEMACTSLLRGDATDGQETFTDAAKALLAQEDYAWRGVYDDRRFDRHVRGVLRRLLKLAKTNDGWANLRRYQ